MFFAQVSRKIGKFDIYVGCENIADYRQHDPILNADNPFSTGFNSMNVWGPLMGRKFYAGLPLRFNPSEGPCGKRDSNLKITRR